MVDDGSFGAVLRRLRKAKGLSHRELAEASGVSIRAISNLERGRNLKPRPDTVHLLADGLGLNEADREELFDAARGRPQAPVAPTATPNNLPEALPPFVGRERDIEAVCALARKSRLVTLTGMGGIGKTRLALVAAVELQAEFPDGRWFVELASLSDPALVDQSIATVVIPRQSGNLSAEEQLVTHLKGRRTLLILDNCEHLLAAAPLVARLLDRCPDLVVIATSQKQLNLPSEVSYQVHPLRLPDKRQHPSDLALAEYDAVALFLARAMVAQQGVPLPSAAIPIVAEIVRRLDGLPLAIELAAARCAVLVPGEVLARLGAQLDLLRDRRGTRNARHASLRAAIDWSYGLLKPGVQALFRRLAVFPGGASLAAAERVCAAAGDLDLDPLDGLQELVQYHLLRAATDEVGERRFTMLGTVREYALECLKAHHEETITQDALLAQIVTLARAAEPELLRGERQAYWARHLVAEQDNLRAALAWASAETPARGLTLASHIGMFWFVHGCSTTEGQGWMARLLARATAETATTAKVHYWLGHLQLFEDVASARRQLDAALEISERLGDDDLMAMTLTALLFALNSLGDADALAVRSAQARALVVRTNHAYLRMTFATFQGYDDERRGALERARQHLDEALVLSERNAIPIFRCIALLQLARVRLFQGADAEGLHLADQLIEASERIAAERYITLGYLQRGMVAEYRGDFVAATDIALAALDRAQRLKDRVSVVACHAFLSRLAMRQGDHQRAQTWLVTGLPLAHELEDRSLIADLLRIRAQACWAAGDQDDARAAATECLTLIQTSGHQRRLIEWLETIVRFAATEAPYVALAWLTAAENHRALIGMPRSPADHLWHDVLLAELPTAAKPTYRTIPPFADALAAASTWLAGTPLEESDARLAAGD